MFAFVFGLYAESPQIWLSILVVFFALLDGVFPFVGYRCRIIVTPSPAGNFHSVSVGPIEFVDEIDTDWTEDYFSRPKRGDKE